MKTINYTGSSKLIARIVNLLNRKTPLPLDGDGDPDWGTNGQFLTTDGAGGTAWSSGGGGGDTVSWTQDVTTGTKIASIDINGNSTDVYAPSGGSGGHTIEDTSGTDLPQEDNLQFVGVYTEDDSANDRTKVNIVRQMTKAAMQALSSAEKEGFIDTTDEDDDYIPISAEDVKYGNTDVDSALDDIYSRISGGSRTVTTLVNESVNLAQSGTKTYATLTLTYLSQFDEVTFLCNWGSPVGALVMTKAMISKTATVYGNSGAVGISSGSHYGSFTFGSSGMVVRNGSSSTMVSLLVEGITY